MDNRGGTRRNEERDAFTLVRTNYTAFFIDYVRFTTCSGIVTVLISTWWFSFAIFNRWKRFVSETNVITLENLFNPAMSISDSSEGI